MNGMGDAVRELKRDTATETASYHRDRLLSLSETRSWLESQYLKLRFEASVLLVKQCFLSGEMPVFSRFKGNSPAHHFKAMDVGPRASALHNA